MKKVISTISGGRKNKPPKKAVSPPYKPITQANIQSVVQRHDSLPVKIPDRVLKKRGFHRPEKSVGLDFKIKTRILMRLTAIAREVEAATGQQFLGVSYSARLDEAVVDYTSGSKVGYHSVMFSTKEII